MTPGDGTCLSPRIRTCCWRHARGSPVQERAGMRVDEAQRQAGSTSRHGHVRVRGSLLVTGDVMPGMRVKTSGDVVIGSARRGGYRIRGGTIMVRNGIIGRKLADDEYPATSTPGGDPRQLCPVRQAGGRWRHPYP